MASTVARGRGPGNSWATLVAVALAVVGVVGLLGGFAPAQDAPRFTLAPGEAQDLGRWRLSVDAAVATTASGRTELAVTATATNTGERSDSGPEGRLVSLVLPTGEVLEEPRFVAESRDLVDPGETSVLVAERIELPASEALPETVLVRVRREEPNPRRPDAWVPGAEVGAVRLPVEDRR